MLIMEAFCALAGFHSTTTAGPRVPRRIGEILHSFHSAETSLALESLSKVPTALRRTGRTAA